MHLQLWLVRHGKTEWSTSGQHMGRADLSLQREGYGESAIIDTNQREWDYGEYEGRTTPEIQIERPSWLLRRDGVIGGERTEQVAARAQRVIDRAAPSSGDVLVFAHGHILCVLAACWLGLPPDPACLFSLDTASVSILGYARETRVFTQWNGGAKDRSHLRIETEHRALASGDSAIAMELSGADCTKLHHTNNKRCIFHHEYRPAGTWNF